VTRSLVGLALVSGLALVPSLEAGADVRRLALVAGANRAPPSGCRCATPSPMPSASRR